MTQPGRRRLLAIDDPLDLAERPAPEPTPAPPVAERREARALRRALFVRLSVEEADAVARAAFELGVHKQDLIGALVRRYIDAGSPEGLAALRATLRRA